MFNSIKLKLVILFLVIFSFFFAGLEVFLYYKLEEVTIHLTDEHIDSEVQTLANLMAVEEAQGQLESELAELSGAVTGIYAEKLSGHYYQILSPEGEVLVRSPSLWLAEETLPTVKATKEPDFRTIEGPANEQIRLMTQSFDFNMGTLTFQAGDSLEETYELLSSFRNVVLLLFPAAFIVCGIGVFIVTGWVMLSIKTFSAKVGQISEENLSERLEEEGVPTELRPLAASFNMMLGRLESSFSKQKQFLSDASHELRTPTTIIKSFCDVTLGRERSSDDYKSAIKKVSDTVNRMCDIINRILVISRLDNKTILLKPVRVDLKDILTDVLKLIEPSAANKGVKIGLTGSNATVRGDREGLTEVLTNVVENAIKYNRPDGRVDISVQEAGGWASVKVTDTGIGIPSVEKDKIFDRFYRVDTSRGVTVGSGLGLSIVRTIVEEHGGRVSVESTEGEGSTFTVMLPTNFEFKSSHEKAEAGKKS